VYRSWRDVVNNTLLSKIFIYESVGLLEFTNLCLLAKSVYIQNPSSNIPTAYNYKLTDILSIFCTDFMLYRESSFAIASPRHLAGRSRPTVIAKVTETEVPITSMGGIKRSQQLNWRSDKRSDLILQSLNEKDVFFFSDAYIISHCFTEVCPTFEDLLR
jgi:hypothetical protein